MVKQSCFPDLFDACIKSLLKLLNFQLSYNYLCSKLIIKHLKMAKKEVWGCSAHPVTHHFSTNPKSKKTVNHFVYSPTIKEDRSSFSQAAKPSFTDKEAFWWEDHYWLHYMKLIARERGTIWEKMERHIGKYFSIFLSPDQPSWLNIQKNKK